ncbi:hypothetical protein [Streptomyces sp. NPDC058297]|uniref:hypothetical protein n=1 Tax=Streptomyces sp. NPDC058297 TaxID=3346433 RepID=UPI0036EE97EC
MCERWGIPHSRFLGGDGTWTDHDRAKALAWRTWRHSVCPDCRTRLDDWEPARGGDPHAYLRDGALLALLPRDYRPAVTRTLTVASDCRKPLWLEVTEAGEVTVHLPAGKTASAEWASLDGASCYAEAGDGC